MGFKAYGTNLRAEDYELIRRMAKIVTHETIEVVDTNSYEVEIHPEDIVFVYGERAYHLTELHTKVFKPEDIYSTCNGIPPDLIVYYGDLSWRSIGNVGTRTIWASENDTGPDDANHSQYGIFIMQHGKDLDGMRLHGVTLYDIAPTILSYMGVTVPEDMDGKVIQ